MSVAEWTLSDILITQELIYKPSHLSFSIPSLQVESSEYGAATFKVGEFNILFRIAKTTPKKIGQFVTLWKRIGDGPILPFDQSDPIDLVVICTRSPLYFGQFVFPKSALLKHNIISNNAKGGKRAMRVYPPWSKTTNPQAQKTQNWQLNYFLDIPADKPINYGRAKKLYTTI